MPKGYSKEIMEALFKEEQENQEKLQAKKAAAEIRKKHQLEEYKKEYQTAKIEELEKRLDNLEKRASRLRIAVTVAIIIALIASAMAFGDSLKEFMLLLP